MSTDAILFQCAMCVVEGGQGKGLVVLYSLIEHIESGPGEYI